MKKEQAVLKQEQEKNKEEKIKTKVTISFSAGKQLSLEEIIENYLCAACIKI